jgi:hypothetical protein
MTSMRFPGNSRIDALYHWSTGSVINPYTNDRAPAFATERKFPAAAPVIDQLGTALITVNYGSNLNGDGGGEPVEPAWVAYVKGKPDGTQAIGKDSKGNDWKTVGYWASLRASAPLATDDGYHALRIKHPNPMGILGSGSAREVQEILSGRARPELGYYEPRHQSLAAGQESRSHRPVRR